MGYCESYETFLKRIFSFERPEFSFGTDCLIPSASVRNKVNEEGMFRIFIGDTTVFELTDSQKNFIQGHYVEPLYRVAGECFAEKFNMHTLHMTLHDLNASLPENIDVLQKIFETEVVLAKKLREVDFKPEHITMVTTCVFNMVNTSLVLGLKPKMQADFEKLMRLYHFVDAFCPLPYPLTPHITLAYYNRKGFEGEELSKIERAVNELNKDNFEVVLSTEDLYYQKFIDMNTFINVMSFVR